uniref:RRM domain-containing protein n=1 Tax=Onchocerca volvulus TaxID=6282 RepID=A0A8R1XNH8_ONCVO
MYFTAGRKFGGHFEWSSSDIDQSGILRVNIMNDSLAFPWALICSVSDKKKFTLWLTSSLQDKAIQYGCSHRFDKEPKIVFHTTPGDEKEIRTTYNIIHRDHPEVIIVFHILPAPNSVEYKLMKELANKYDLIRQGVLLEKAITYFEECNIEEVLGNILQWFSRCISRFVALEKKTSTKFSLRIGEEGNNSTKIVSFSMNNVTAAVLRVLHDKNEEISQNINAEAVVEVCGYPSNFNEFEIANIFNNFRVIKVTKSLINGINGAVVEFVNEIHAAQAAIEYDQKWIDSKHLLSVMPIHPEVIKEVKLILINEYLSCQSSRSLSKLSLKESDL